jgi:hypothetical protein
MRRLFLGALMCFVLAMAAGIVISAARDLAYGKPDAVATTAAAQRATVVAVAGASAAARPAAVAAISLPTQKRL